MRHGSLGRPQGGDGRNATVVAFPPPPPCTAIYVSGCDQYRIIWASAPRAAKHRTSHFQASSRSASHPNFTSEPTRTPGVAALAERLRCRSAGKATQSGWRPTRDSARGAEPPIWIVRFRLLRRSHERQGAGSGFRRLPLSGNSQSGRMSDDTGQQSANLKACR